MKFNQQRGIALVMTLILLSIITFLAVAFLFLSRRDRASVTVTQNQTDSKLMADAALARAQSEAVAGMMAKSNLLYYDYAVSRNFINTNGFSPAQTVSSATNLYATNVNYEYTSTRLPLTTDQLILNIGNLFYDPRPPVFVSTNQGSFTNFDFRYYIDFNRNGQFDTNGFQLVGTNRIYFHGDPEWIGVLDKPGYPHSPTNRFLGRYAYIILPAGKMLDLNYIHNYAKGTAFPAAIPNSFLPDMQYDGFMRNQGFGSWELNLGGFFRALNTNVWVDNFYTNTASLNSTKNFTNALEILRYRYGGGATPFLNLSNLVGNAAFNTFTNDHIDGYSDGPIYITNNVALVDDDLPLRPWPGNDSPARIYSIEDLFDANKFSTNLTYNVKGGFGATDTASLSYPYDRNTFYRLMSQIGTDSAAELEGKIHLNYTNSLQDPLSFTNYAAWTPSNFFTIVADRLIQDNIRLVSTNGLVTNTVFDGRVVETALSITNIQLYPTNHYTPALHRLLQLAANIYDASTNRTTNGSPYYPSVFRPVIVKKVNGSVYITNFVYDVTTNFLGAQWTNLTDVATKFPVGIVGVNIFGQPLVIGAKKGWPNFNEFAMQTLISAERKLEVRRQQVNLLPYQTNQMLIVAISNVFGMEAWNSYTQAFPRPLQIAGFGYATLVVTNETTTTPLLLTNLQPYFGGQFIPGSNWPGGQLRVPVFTNNIGLSNSVYSEASLPRFQPLVDPLTKKVRDYDRGYGFPDHKLGLMVTNKMVYYLIDNSNIVDYVSFADMTSFVDVSGSLAGLTNDFSEAAGPGRFWITNKVRNSPSSIAPTWGVSNQVWVGSHGDALARFSYNTYSNQIWSFSNFIYNAAYTNKGLTAECPYTPSRRMQKVESWQVNDPLVHYMLSDIKNFGAQTNIADPFTTTNPPSLRTYYLGVTNDAYQPWDGNPYKSQANDPNAHNLAIKDPGVYSPDNWDFPTNKFPNVGWLGRVHRGTPWQTIYLKSTIADSNTWVKWSRSTMGAHPTNDWRLLDLFTVAPNENAARGLLSVNQSGQAAWAAVLGDVLVLSNSLRTGNFSRYTKTKFDPVFVEPASVQLSNIVANINATRLAMSNQVFNSIGDLLAADTLTVKSPYLNAAVLQNGAPNLEDPQRAFAINDAAYERIPQQIASLLQLGKPRFVIYSFGQSLKPADRSIISSAPDARLINLCTNYQITGEVVTRTVLRVEGTPQNPRTVIENFQILSGD